MNATAFSQKDYENEPPSGPKKQSQNKPNFNTKKTGQKLNFLYNNIAK